MVRKAYRYLRHPRIRNRPWLFALTKPLYNRELWKPTRHSMASGVSTGIFFAMLPIPFQMLFSAFFCMPLKGNVPIAMATCWVSNPFTHPPLLILQMDFGHWLRSFTHLPLPFDEKAHIDFLGFSLTGNPADFYVGCLVMALLLCVISYPIIFGVSSLILERHKSSPKEDSQNES